MARERESVPPSHEMASGREEDGGRARARRTLQDPQSETESESERESPRVSERLGSKETEGACLCECVRECLRGIESVRV